MSGNSSKTLSVSSVVGIALQYIESQRREDSLEEIHQIVQDLRYKLRHVIEDQFLELNLDECRSFRRVLNQELTALCRELLNQEPSKPSQEAPLYCSDILNCFKWAEQIKAEIPDDLVTQRVLIKDLPIFEKALADPEETLN